MPDPSPVSLDDFDSFYASYREYITSVLHRLGYPHDYDDGVQEVMLRVWRHRDEYRPSESNGWHTVLYHIAKNIVIDAVRLSEFRNRALLPGGYDRADDDRHLSPERRLLSKERGSLLNRLLTGLTPIERVAVLSFNAGITASEWPVSSTTRRRLRTHAYRGRQHMRRAMLQDPETYAPLLDHLGVDAEAAWQREEEKRLEFNRNALRRKQAPRLA